MSVTISYGEITLCTIFHWFHLSEESASSYFYVDVQTFLNSTLKLWDMGGMWCWSGWYNCWHFSRSSDATACEKDVRVLL